MGQRQGEHGSVADWTEVCKCKVEEAIACSQLEVVVQQRTITHTRTNIGIFCTTWVRQETLIFTRNMSPAEPSRPSKRKWDQPAPGEDGTTPKAAKTDESRTASEAAAAAAAIAAKIAAQFASGALGSGDKEHDAEFMQDIDINDVRNRYLLTRGSTQDQVCNVVFFLTNFQAV